MAVDVYPENLIGIISPRISFSHDLQEDEKKKNLAMEEDYPCRSAIDFAFDVDTSSTFQPSNADELFSNGKILPTSIKDDEKIPIKQPDNVMPCLDPRPRTETITEPSKKNLKEFLEDSIEEEEEEEEPNREVKSFWKFRSNSLNCEGNQRKGLIGSWKVLSRSGSTGKFLAKIVEDEEEKPNSKFSWKLPRSSNDLNCQNFNGNLEGINGSSKILRRGNPRLIGSYNFLARSNSTGSPTNPVRNKKQQQQQPPPKQQNFDGDARSFKGKVNNVKGYGYGYGNHNSIMRISSPVLNLPSPYISRVTIDLFGFGSLFCNGMKDKTKKR